MNIRIAWGMLVLLALVGFAFWAGKQIGARSSAG